MPLWGNKDQANNAPMQAASQVHQTTNPTNQANLFANTTGNVAIQGVTVGVFGVDPIEQQATQQQAHAPHSGWVLRTVGQGGRAGRVFMETLVATATIQGEGDGATIPNTAIFIRTQPQSQKIAPFGTAQLSVDAVGYPVGTSLQYFWQMDGANVANAGIFSGNNSPTLSISNTTNLSANVFTCLITSNTNKQVTTAPAYITIGV